MQISGMNKLTLLDYPGEIACLIFTQGCNFKCQFCHNSTLIPLKQVGTITEEELLSYLNRRKNVLTGVVISGGEPLMQPGLKELIKTIKALGFKIKLDTNGTNLILLEELLRDHLIDYLAMDLKGDAENYAWIIGQEQFDFKLIEKAINLITNAGIDYEFRTTVVKEFHDITMLSKLCALLPGDAKYYLQNYVDSDNVLIKGLHGFTDNELKTMTSKLNKKYPNVLVRGQ